MNSWRYPRRRVPAWLAGVLLSLLSAGCGGGVTFFLGGDDLPPVVDLAAASLSVPAGTSVRLAAAAADESGIDHVSFYRYDGNTAVRLGSDVSPPYEWQFFAPTDGRTSVIVFARAVDVAGNAADSGLVTISITP